MSSRTNNYIEWMKAQSKEFIEFVCGDNPIGHKYKDYGSPITLEELEVLSERFINGQAEPEQQKPGGQE